MEYNSYICRMETTTKIKPFIRGNEWVLLANKLGSNIMNDYDYQIKHEDGRISKPFKIADSLELLNIFKMTRKKFDIFCENKFASIK